MMRLATYEAMHGEEIDFDLDAVIDVVDGHSGLRPGWKALIVYDPTTDAFIELGSTTPEPPDLHRMPAEYAVEVDDAYLRVTYALADDQLRSVRKRPSEWTPIHQSAPNP